jgi:signal transduction histidine kinase
MLKFNPQNLNLRTIVDENINNLHLQVTNKNITLSSELNEDLFICADKNMINTILRNLLSNAVKYTYKNGNISVRVTNGTNEVIVTVSDSGIGISKEKAETLFRLENSPSLPGTEKEQGTGLGLKLCKEFTGKMGGRIWVESNSGKGSEFKFTIPLNGTKAQGPKDATES